MDEKKHRITSKQLMCFIVSSQIGFGIITLPSTLAGAVGHDGWISVLAAGGISTLSSFLILTFLKRYKDKPIYKINLLLYGKIIGIVFNIMFFVYLWITTSMIFRLFLEFTKITVLKITPTYAISAIIIIPTLYMVWCGLKVLSRFSGMLFNSFIIALLFFIFIAKDVRISFILPIGESGISKIVYGMMLSGFSYLGTELVSVIYPHITDKENARKYAVIGNIITTLFFTTIVFISTALVGEWKLKMLAFPLFNISTSVRIPIVERADLLFIMLWFPIMGNAIRLYFFTTYYSLEQKLNKSNKLFLIIFTLLIMLTGKIPKDLVDVYFYINLIGYIGVGIIGLLIFSLLFSFINKRGVNNEAEK